MRRVLPSLVVFVTAAVVCLTGCGSGPDNQTARADRDRLCQVATLGYSSLAGARDNVREGSFYAEDAESYRKVIDQVLDTAASGSTAYQAADDVVGLVEALSRTRSFLVANADTDVYDSDRPTRLLAEEDDAMDAVEESCS